MIRHNFKLFAWLLVVITLTIFGILSYVQIEDVNNIQLPLLVKLLSQTVTCVTIFGYLFNRYLWHWRIFTYCSWFVKVPYLAGEWTGILRYYWDNRWQEKEMKMLIKQTFLHIQVSIYTNESWSKTIGGTFDIDEENGFNSLIYSYQNTPDASVREHSPMHYGTAILSISKDCKELRGNYFTDRKTTGEMKLSKK